MQRQIEYKKYWIYKVLVKWNMQIGLKIFLTWLISIPQTKYNRLSCFV